MEILSIQYLRAVAACMVVAVHLHPQLERMGYVGYWPHWMAGGVDIFFVLSGFLMWVTTSGRSVSTTEFYRRRIVRIVPMYWVLTTVPVTLLILAPQLLQTTQLGIWNAIASYLFVFSSNPAGLVEPVLTVGWTLNFEMLFYLIFGLALWMPVRWRFMAVSGALGCLMLAGIASPEKGTVWAAYTSSIMLEFLLGMALGWWQLHPSRPVNARTGMLMIVGGFAAMAISQSLFPTLPRILAGGLPALAIMAGALIIERSGKIVRVGWWHLLGNASYSIYLSHPVTLSGWSQGWRRLGLEKLPNGGLLFSLTGTAVALMVGVGIYLLIEKPMLRLFQRRKPSQASSVTQAATSV